MKTGLVVTLGFCAVTAGAYILDGWPMVKFFAGLLLLIGGVSGPFLFMAFRGEKGTR
jgi:hypothetical protein